MQKRERRKRNSRGEKDETKEPNLCLVLSFVVQSASQKFMYQKFVTCRGPFQFSDHIISNSIHKLYHIHIYMNIIWSKL